RAGALAVWRAHERDARVARDVAELRELVHLEAQAREQVVLIAVALVRRVRRARCKELVDDPVLELHRVEPSRGRLTDHVPRALDVTVVVDADLGHQPGRRRVRPERHDASSCARARSSSSSTSIARVGSTNASAMGGSTSGPPAATRAAPVAFASGGTSWVRRSNSDGTSGTPVPSGPLTSVNAVVGGTVTAVTALAAPGASSYASTTATRSSTVVNGAVGCTTSTSSLDRPPHAPSAWATTGSIGTSDDASAA